jgi:hypothetical protein
MAFINHCQLMKQFNIKQVIEVDRDYSIRVVSTSVSEVGGELSLMEKALNYLQEKGFFDIFSMTETSRYVAFRTIKGQKGNNRYQLILKSKKDGLYISVQNVIPNLPVVFEPDAQFPYTVKTFVENDDSLFSLLDKLIPFFLYDH